MQFSDQIQTFINEEFNGVNFEELDLNALKQLRTDISQKREEYALLELACKLSGNAAYGASANPSFPFFNVNLAADITGECRALTKFMWQRLEDFFHVDIWERKDLWKQFDFELDESKKKWYSGRHVSLYADTDSSCKDTMLKIRRNDTKNNKKVSNYKIEDLYKQLEIQVAPTHTESGHEIIKPLDEIEVLNYNKENKDLEFVKIKRVIRHKVSKPKFKIKTKSGKEIIVTGDHSCIVFRNGEQLTIKAKDINKETDKILSVVSE